MRAWLAALADRLPVDAGATHDARVDDLVALRAAVRAALHAALERRPVPDESLAELNRTSGASPESLQLGRHGPETRYHAQDATDVVLGVIASSTIALVGGSQAGDLRACGAPGCVLMFVKDHPRREWCSTACGNRARQARHYARTKPQPAPERGRTR